MAKIDDAKWRVKVLLTAIESDRKNSTEHVSNKFVAKTDAVFAGLPKPKDRTAFANHDLPLLFTPDEVQQFAMEHKLNKSRIVHVPSLLLAEHAENEIRKEFTPSERVAIAKAIEAEIGNRRGGNQHQKKELDQNFGQANGARTYEIAAEKAGFGNPETYRQAKAVVDNADPELIDAMDRGAIASRFMPNPFWLKIRTVAWFLYGDPRAFLDHADQLAGLIMRARFDQ